MKKQIFFVSILFLVNTFNIQAQNYSEQGEKFFSKYLSQKAMTELAFKSLPTLEECKLVFKGQNAYTFFGKIQEFKNLLPTLKNEKNETFAEVDIEVFSTQDIEKGKGNYAGGMKNILDKLQPYVLFYKVEQLREKGAELGVAYKYWTNINGRWVFFPKLYSAFDN